MSGNDYWNGANGIPHGGGSYESWQQHHIGQLSRANHEALGAIGKSFAPSNSATSSIYVGTYVAPQPYDITQFTWENPGKDLTNIRIASLTLRKNMPGRTYDFLISLKNYSETQNTVEVGGNKHVLEANAQKSISSNIKTHTIDALLSQSDTRSFTEPAMAADYKQAIAALKQMHADRELQRAAVRKQIVKIAVISAGVLCIATASLFLAGATHQYLEGRAIDKRAEEMAIEAERERQQELAQAARDTAKDKLRLPAMQAEFDRKMQGVNNVGSVILADHLGPKNLFAYDYHLTLLATYLRIGQRASAKSAGVEYVPATQTKPVRISIDRTINGVRYSGDAISDAAQLKFQGLRPDSTARPCLNFTLKATLPSQTLQQLQTPSRVIKERYCFKSPK